MAIAVKGSQMKLISTSRQILIGCLAIFRINKVPFPVVAVKHVGIMALVGILVSQQGKLYGEFLDAGGNRYLPRCK